MPIATPSAVRKQISAGTVHPIYLLLGEDDVEKSALAHEFDGLIEEGLRAFNVDRIHAGDLTTGERLAAGVASLVTAARTLPMMAPRRIVIVSRAEVMLAPKRESDLASRALDDLEDLFKAPEKETTILLLAGNMDKRGRLYKLLLKQATVVECGITDNAEMWIRNRLTAAGMQIEPDGARLLAERCGTDVKRLRNDVDRLLLYALGQRSITLGDVRQIVGPITLQDDWAMTNAIEAQDGAEALRQLALMLEAGAPPEKILGQLGWLVRTKSAALPAGRVPAAIEAVFRTDLDLKRSAGDPRVLLERLVVELTAGHRASSGQRPKGAGRER